MSLSGRDVRYHSPEMARCIFSSHYGSGRFHLDSSHLVRVGKRSIASHMVRLLRRTEADIEMFDELSDI